MRSDCDCSAAGDCVLVVATVWSDHEDVLRTTFVPLVLQGDEGGTMPAIMITNRNFFSPRFPAAYNRDPAKDHPNSGKATIMISWQYFS